MKFTTLTARFPGTCKRCNRPINVGEIIRYGGKGQTYHLAAICTSDAVQAQQPVPQPQPVTSVRNDVMPTMTPALAADIRSLFDSLLAKPATLADFEPKATTDDSPTDQQPESAPETFTFETIHGTTWTQPATTPAIRRTATIDADLF